MLAGALLLAIAAIGAAYASLVIKAAPKRRDNLLFGGLAAMDAALIAWRGFNVLAGEPIVATTVLLPCGIGTIAMKVLTFEFLVGFPRHQPMRAGWRAAMLVWATGGAAVLLVVDRGTDWSHSITQYVLYGPGTLVVFALCARAWRRTRDRDARTVIAMLAFRWGFGFSAYFLGPRLGLFEEALWAETTFATLVSFVVIGTAVMRTDLFSIRSSAGEALVVATLAFCVVAGGGAVVRVVLGTTEPARAAAGAAGRRDDGAARARRAPGWLLYPRLEKRVLAPLDARRNRRLDMLDEPLPVAPRDAIGEAIRRITAIADGAAVRWQLASSLPPALVARAGDGDVVRGDELACLVVPALGASRAVVGAFLLDRTPGARCSTATPTWSRATSPRASRWSWSATTRSPRSSTRAGSPSSASSPPRSLTTSARR